MEQRKGVDGAALCLPEPIRIQLTSLSPVQKSRIEEFRFRLGQPIAAVTKDGMRYLQGGKLLPFQRQAGLYLLSRKDLESIFFACCNDSVHSYEEQIRQGFITLPGGHRLGICGTAVIQSGKIKTVREITSLNLRIARQVKGVAEKLLWVLEDGFRGLLLAGAPGTGKTTLLRDLTLEIPETLWGKNKKLVVIDERGEIGGISQGCLTHDLGPNCDVMDGYPKAEGILIALRTLSPDVILCDEVGAMEDVEAIRQGINSGVRFVATLHAGTQRELFRRPQMKALAETQGFSHIALLSSSGERGIIQEWMKL